MLALRKIWTVLVGAWVGAFLARAVLDWVLGLDGPWVGIGVIVAALIGGALSITEAREVQPMPAGERRDTILGWGALVGGVAAVACLFIPMPWGAVAAAAVVVVTVVSLHRVPAPPTQEH